jgi:hypothetical protein
VNDVAKMVATFMNTIHEKFQVNPSNATCIGHSLGSHICGMTKEHLKGGKFGKIIALDPANPLFSINDPMTRLNNESANYVECIHTGYFFGIRAPICQSNFVVNKGSHQPTCVNALGLDNVPCSHTKSVYFYTESIDMPKSFYGKKCEYFEMSVQSVCHGNEGEFMGDEENASKMITGNFQVVTNQQIPFGRGKE